MTCRQAVDARQRLYKLLQVGKREVAMSDDDYRALLARHGATEVDGRPSASTLSISQLEQALESLKRAGFRPRRGKPHYDWRQPRIDKAYALWCALYDGQVVRDRQFTAFERWSRSLTKSAKLEWADSHALNAVIEALKSWASRERVAFED